MPPVADVVVVGAGIAGQYAALVAAREGARVVLVSRSPLSRSASYWAQGGIAAALGEDDSSERHLADTLAAGRGAGRESAARVLCDEAPSRVRELARLGVDFDTDSTGALVLGMEGGHSARRVAHAGGSATGQRVTSTLAALVAGEERIEVMEGADVRALLVGQGRCVGARVAAGSGAPSVLGRGTVLATGGAGALWERTTNPSGAVGAGMMLAHAAGAALADLELVQFHPTALVSLGQSDGFLITEAIRGEGALLRGRGGERFVDELAPRDEVALAITAEIAAGGAVHLDMRRVDPARFPNVAAALAAAGIDPRRDLVPVAPAAHYTIGGVATDVDGRSSLRGLFAIGECAAGGLHGANRLASNSLADCVVFGRRAAHAALGEPAPPRSGDAGPRLPPGPWAAPGPATREALWRLAGLERTADELRALTADPFPLAQLIARSALAREESRGVHRRREHPEPDPALEAMHAVVRGAEPPAFERWP